MENNDANIQDSINILKQMRSESSDEAKSQAIRNAIEALGKQIPKFPNVKPWEPARCPCCGTELSDFIGDGYYKHWSNKTICECGQKLRW